MTYDQFLAKYNGGFWDYDHYYRDQCMDLISFYSQELGLTHLGGNAADVANQYPAGYAHVSVPQRGDIVVFARNAANGWNGHIAIYDRPYFYFSQNYPTGSNSHIQYINEPIIAILRPLTQGGTVTDQQYNDLKADRDRYAESWADLKYRIMRNGQAPTRDERRLRLGLPWEVANAAIEQSAEWQNSLPNQFKNGEYVPVTEQLFRKK